MAKADKLLAELFSIRNRYGGSRASEKLKLLMALGQEKSAGKKALQLWYDALLFLLAYPDDKNVFQAATEGLRHLEAVIESQESLQTRLFNTGLTKTSLCAAFSFEIVKWLKQEYPDMISLDSFDAEDGQLQSILAAVMPKVESEILQDANTNWRLWIKETLSPRQDTLDRLISIFDQSGLRPEIKDELWAAIGVNVEIHCRSHLRLPSTLIKTHYHKKLIRKDFSKRGVFSMKKIRLSGEEAQQVLDCGRMILIRHLREIDPISYSDSPFVSFYQLPRGLSVALTGMVPARRHPIDSYMGYLVFKNGLPVAYAASWILFDSARIGLNVFPSYRGGESQYIFDQVLKLHSKVYRLNRFSVDPYQLGKENSDGIKSGAFWVYYHAGFRPLKRKQLELGRSEFQKLTSTSGYRSSLAVLRTLADSRMEKVLKEKAVRFDATDLSRAYAAVVKSKNNSYGTAGGARLARILKIRNYSEVNMLFILMNWSTLLLSASRALGRDKVLQKTLKKLFQLKADGWEENYIREMQQSNHLRKLLEEIVERNVPAE